MHGVYSVLCLLLANTKSLKSSVIFNTVSVCIVNCLKVSCHVFWLLVPNKSGLWNYSSSEIQFQTKTITKGTDCGKHQHQTDFSCSVLSCFHQFLLCFHCFNKVILWHAFHFLPSSTNQISLGTIKFWAKLKLKCQLVTLSVCLGSQASLFIMREQISSPIWQSNVPILKYQNAKETLPPPGSVFTDQFLTR